MGTLELISPKSDLRTNFKRPGFNLKQPYEQPYESNILPPEQPPIAVYEVSRLTHRGIIGFKRFDGLNRTLRRSSLENLLTCTSFENDTLNNLVTNYKMASTNWEKEGINNQAYKLLTQELFDKYLTLTHQSRKLNEAQSRNIRKMADKLSYYSANRKFTSKKTGTYNFKIGFITLTAPEDSNPISLLNAFNRFLEYLHRTANCHYVWKKELGEQGKALHFHIMVNNFIPYYIVSWKWKRALLAEEITLPVKEDGKETNSHYRIELPRNARQVGKYISKYMSKAYELPGSYGYIAGYSRILNDLKEVYVEPDMSENEEIRELIKTKKIIKSEYVTVVCVDLLTVKDKYPKLFSLFEKQYLEFCEKITLPQKFNYV